MKLVLTTPDAVLKQGITLRYLGIFTLMESCGLRGEVKKLIPIGMGKESSLTSRPELIVAVGPVCKVVADDLRNPATALPDRVPGDVIHCDNGMTIAVVAVKGRSPFARFLTRVQRFLNEHESHEVLVEIR